MKWHRLGLVASSTPLRRVKFILDITILHRGAKTGPIPSIDFLFCFVLFCFYLSLSLSLSPDKRIIKDNRLATKTVIGFTYVCLSVCMFLNRRNVWVTDFKKRRSIQIYLNEGNRRYFLFSISTIST